MAQAKTYKKSPSGYYLIKLNAVWSHEGFLYKPSQAVTLDEATLDLAIAADVVESIVAAD